MDENNAKIEEFKKENDRLVKANTKRDNDNKRLSDQLDEALACLKKMEEVRNAMNRLMGPKGVLEEHERYKYLLSRGEEEDPEAAGNAKVPAIEAGAASKNMLGSNNEYFYNDSGA